MKKIMILLAAAMTVLGLLFLPSVAQAKVASLDGMTCETAVTDITPEDEFDVDERSEENFQVFWYYITVGEKCTMEVSFDEVPLMLFVSGGEMTMDSNWVIDKSTKSAEISFTSREIQQIDSQVENGFDDGDTLTTVAFIWEADEGDGPGEESNGAWVATDFQEYTLITDSTKMGAEVQGDEGDEGKFAMYTPPASVGFMAVNHENYDDSDFDVEGDMAVYLGSNEQKKTGVTETEDGGAFLSFSATIDADDVVSEDEGKDEGGDENIIDCDGDGEPDDIDESELEEGVDPCKEGAQSVAAGGSAGVAVRVTAGPRDAAVKPDAPKKKKNKVKKKAKKYAVLNWADVSGATSYTLHLRKCKNDKKKKCTKTKHFQKKKNYRKFKNIEVSQKKVKKLKQGRYYQWRVKACNDTGCSEFTDWKRFVTKR